MEEKCFEYLFKAKKMKINVKLNGRQSKQYAVVQGKEVQQNAVQKQM
jgi:hypothetical protein